MLPFLKSTNFSLYIYVDNLYPVPEQTMPAESVSLRKGGNSSVGSGKGKAEETQGGTPTPRIPGVGIAGFESSAKQAVEQIMNVSVCKCT